MVAAVCQSQEIIRIPLKKERSSSLRSGLPLVSGKGFSQGGPVGRSMALNDGQHAAASRSRLVTFEWRFNEAFGVILTYTQTPTESYRIIRFLWTSQTCQAIYLFRSYGNLSCQCNTSFVHCQLICTCPFQRPRLSPNFNHRTFEGQAELGTAPWSY